MNKLPNGWEEKRLDDLFKEFTEKNHADKNILASTQDRGVIPSDLLDRHIIRKKESLSNYKLVKKGCFVISLRSFQGGFEYSNYEGIISPAYTILEPKMKLVDDFYKYYFKSYYFINKSLPKYAEGIRDGKQIKYKACKEILVPYPPLDEQKRIASALSKIDAYLENTIKLIEEKERFKRGIAKKLLTCKEGENIPEARFKGFEDEWEETQILEFVNNNIIKIEKGKSITKSKIEEGDIPVIAGGKTPPYYHNKYNYNFPCITISASGSAGYVWFHDYKIWASDCYVIYTDNKRYNIKFLYHYLKNIQDLIYYLQVGGVQKHVYAKDLIKLNIPNITIEEQEKIGGYLSLLDAEIDNLKKQKELIKEMKRGAMQKLLSGEVRLSKNEFNENI